MEIIYKNSLELFGGKKALKFFIFGTLKLAFFLTFWTELVYLKLCKLNFEL